ncbi:MAG: hypothetical protein P8Y37_05975 [Anaerolineales bacterium]
MGWFARVATMLLAAALFVLLFGLATLAVAMVAATAVVTGKSMVAESPGQRRAEPEGDSGQNAGSGIRGVVIKQPGPWG